MNFKKLGVSQELLKLLDSNKITIPTEIQEQAIPLLLQGKDLIGKAQTGTGKTLAFLLPILERLDQSDKSNQALIITPTRELALQITQVAKILSPVKEIGVLTVYGGQDVQQQIRKLKKGVHLIIGTPGRILDHMHRGTINSSNLRFLVLDEADQMLDMGFQKDIEAIIQRTPKTRQTMLFSATIPSKIKMLSNKYMRNIHEVSIHSRHITLDEIKQYAILTTEQGKQEALFSAIEKYHPFMAIIFCRTKRRAASLNEALKEKGYQSEELHGDLTQGKREKVMKTFRNLKIQFLVATDVAARGLDIQGITHIFNYDIPQDTESYIHRIGRTGRAGEEGMAITLVAQREKPALQEIEKGIGLSIDRITFGLEDKNLKKLQIPRDNKTRSPHDIDKKRMGHNRFGQGAGKRTGKGTGKSAGKKPGTEDVYGAGKSERKRTEAKPIHRSGKAFEKGTSHTTDKRGVKGPAKGTAKVEKTSGNYNMRKGSNQRKRAARSFRG